MVELDGEFYFTLIRRLGEIAGLFFFKQIQSVNPEFAFGFTLLGSKIFIHIPSQDAFKLMIFRCFPIFGGIHPLRNSVINPWKTEKSEKPKWWIANQKNMNLREYTEGPKQMVQLFICAIGSKLPLSPYNRG